MDRLVDRLLSLPLLAVAIACVMHAYPLLAIGAESLAHPLADFASMRLTGFLVAALVLVLGALLFLAGLLPGRPAHRATVVHTRRSLQNALRSMLVMVSRARASSPSATRNRCSASSCARTASARVSSAFASRSDASASCR